MMHTIAENARFKWECDDEHRADFAIETDKYTHGVRVCYIDEIPPDAFPQTLSLEW